MKSISYVYFFLSFFKFRLMLSVQGRNRVIVCLETGPFIFRSSEILDIRAFALRCGTFGEGATSTLYLRCSIVFVNGGGGGQNFLKILQNLEMKSHL